MASDYNFDNRGFWLIKQSIISEGLERTKGILYGNAIDDDLKDSALFQEDLANITNVEFSPTKYINDENEEDTYPDVKIRLPICQIDYRVNKNVVETKLINQSSSIKEITHVNDPEITIKGILVGSYNYPEKDDVIKGKPKEDMKRLKKLAVEPMSVKVESEYLSTLDVDRLIVLSVHFPQNNDRYNLQDFTLKCIADDVFEPNPNENLE